MKKYIFLLIFICLSVNVQSQNKKSLLKKGNKLFKDSLYNDAEIKYRKSLEKDQDYFGASYNLANSTLKSPETEFWPPEFQLTKATSLRSKPILFLCTAHCVV